MHLLAKYRGFLLIKLNTSNNYDLSHLTNHDAPSFTSILTGISKGDIWLDHPVAPKVALVYSSAVGGYSFLGETTEKNRLDSIETFLKGSFFNDLSQNNIDFFEFSIESTRMTPYFMGWFVDQPIVTEKEYTYKLLDTEIRNVQLPEAYLAYPINSDSIHEISDFTGFELFSERLEASWHSEEFFFNNSFAFVIVHHAQIVGIIMGTGRFQNTLAIDVFVHHEHRKKGLALGLVHLFINECLEKKVTPHWNCTKSNKGSQLLAEKAGLVKVETKLFYMIPTAP